ncbi:MAG: RHS repeat protein [Fibrobacteres bacterium]|nr:RHS repeat protein [Fibrobacterota bacterium]
MDDFVIAPTDAKVALTSYDQFGRVMSNIDPDGHVTTTEYDARGAVQALRDERGRIFGQSSLLPSTEN